MEHVRKVTKGWKESSHGTPMLPLLDTFIEAVYGDLGEPSVVFLNDPRWLMFGMYMPHTRLLRSLKSLVDQT
jgi:hypothetical protein